MAQRLAGCIFFNLAIVGSVLIARLFRVPPVAAGGVVGNFTLFHQYITYTSSGSLKMRCRRGYAGVTFLLNRHTHDRSGCFFPSAPHAHRSWPVSIFSCGQVRARLARGGVTASQGWGHQLTGPTGFRFQATPAIVTVRSDDRSRDDEQDRKPGFETLMTRLSGVTQTSRDHKWHGVNG